MSKQIVEGKIDKLFVKDFGEQDQYGNQYGVSINIDGQWFGLGKKKKPSANIKNGAGWHQLAEGDVIEAVAQTVERNGRTYNNVRSSDITLKETGNGGNTGSATGNSNSRPSAASSVSNAGGGDRQDAIMRQSAMNYAAQIIAGTLTSKSDLDQAAADVVRIANDYFLPYAQHGVTEDETRKAEEQELTNQQHSKEEDFDDDIPF
jgi:hypothetical protein